MLRTPAWPCGRAHDLLVVRAVLAPVLFDASVSALHAALKMSPFAAFHRGLALYDSKPVDGAAMMADAMRRGGPFSFQLSSCFRLCIMLLKSVFTPASVVVRPPFVGLSTERTINAAGVGVLHRCVGLIHETVNKQDSLMILTSLKGALSDFEAVLATLAAQAVLNLQGALHAAVGQPKAAANAYRRALLLADGTNVVDAPLRCVLCLPLARAALPAGLICHFCVVLPRRATAGRPLPSGCQRSCWVITAQREQLSSTCPLRRLLPRRCLCPQARCSAAAFLARTLSRMVVLAYLPVPQRAATHGSSSMHRVLLPL